MLRPVSRVIRCVNALTLSASQQSQLTRLLQLAQQDRFLHAPDEPVVREGEYRMAVLCEEAVAGFFSPRRQSMLGKVHWRAGALFLETPWRGQGVMEHALRAFFLTHLPALAWVDDANAPSLKLFAALGFAQGKAKAAQDGGQGHWYTLCAPAQRTPALEGLPGYQRW